MAFMPSAVFMDHTKILSEAYKIFFVDFVHTSSIQSDLLMDKAFALYTICAYSFVFPVNKSTIIVTNIQIIPLKF